jgi:L-aspartate oxidase
VLHAQDRTGGALVDALERRVLERPGLLRLQGALALQLWMEAGRCRGLQVLHSGELRWLGARAVVLATGGGGHLFANTTNPSQASGDGIAMAWRAGATIRDLEFVQFHPTALMLPGAPHFLISEAVRGEGARLLDAAGRSPVSQLNGGDLAARDAVSRALVQCMREQQQAHLWLDLRPVGRDRLERQFPTILGRCRELGLDPTGAPIPVAPAAHYWMGGVRTDQQAATTVPGLYAVGEVASTGVHGANRLASNSLMECLVYARQLRHIQLPAWDAAEAGLASGRSAPARPLTGARPGSPEGLQASIEQLRQLCWQVAGVERRATDLRHGLRDCRRQRLELEQQALLQQTARQSPGEVHTLDAALSTWLRQAHALNQRLLVSELLLEAALFRQESRGGHYRLDAPAAQPFWRRHTVQRQNQGIGTEPVAGAGAEAGPL